MVRWLDDGTHCACVYWCEHVWFVYKCINYYHSFVFVFSNVDKKNDRNVLRFDLTGLFSF